MIRVAALLVAGAVLAAGVPAAADGISREKRPVITKKIKKSRIVRRRLVTEKTVVVEQKPAPPVVLVPAPPPPPTPVYVWLPGHWTWNSPMSMHVWVPGMYIRPPSPEEEQNLALRRIGQWFGIGRDE